MQLKTDYNNVSLNENNFISIIQITDNEINNTIQGIKNKIENTDYSQRTEYDDKVNQMKQDCQTILSSLSNIENSFDSNQQKHKIGGNIQIAFPNEAQNKEKYKNNIFFYNEV